jgi:integrase
VGSVVVSKPAPTAVFRTVPEQLNRSGKRHADKRTREYLTPDEMARLIATACKHRHGLRDSLMLVMAYWHALRRRSWSSWNGPRSISRPEC